MERPERVHVRRSSSWDLTESFVSYLLGVATVLLIGVLVVLNFNILFVILAGILAVLIYILIAVLMARPHRRTTRISREVPGSKVERETIIREIKKEDNSDVEIKQTTVKKKRRPVKKKSA